MMTDDTDDTNDTDSTDDEYLERADRLQSRRSRRQKGQASQAEQEKQEPQTEQDKQTPQMEQAPVTSRTHSTYYIHDDLESKLERAWAELEFEYKANHSFEPEKNRHFRPLLLHLGLEKLAEMELEEIDDVLDTTDYLDATGLSLATDGTNE